MHLRVGWLAACGAAQCRGDRCPRRAFRRLARRRPVLRVALDLAHAHIPCHDKHALGDARHPRPCSRTPGHGSASTSRSTRRHRPRLPTISPCRRPAPPRTRGMTHTRRSSGPRSPGCPAGRPCPQPRSHRSSPTRTTPRAGAPGLMPASCPTRRLRAGSSRRARADSRGRSTTTPCNRRGTARAPVHMGQGDLFGIDGVEPLPDEASGVVAVQAADPHARRVVQGVRVQKSPFTYV